MDLYCFVLEHVNDIPKTNKYKSIHDPAKVITGVKIIHHHELQLYKLYTISIIIEEIIESESIIIEAMEWIILIWLLFCVFINKLYFLFFG